MAGEFTTKLEFIDHFRHTRQIVGDHSWRHAAKDISIEYLCCRFWYNRLFHSFRQLQPPTIVLINCDDDGLLITRRVQTGATNSDDIDWESGQTVDEHAHAKCEFRVSTSSRDDRAGRTHFSLYPMRNGAQWLSHHFGGWYIVRILLISIETCVVSRWLYVFIWNDSHDVNGIFFLNTVGYFFPDIQWKYWQ